MLDCRRHGIRAGEGWKMDFLYGRLQKWTVCGVPILDVKTTAEEDEKPRGVWLNTLTTISFKNEQVLSSHPRKPQSKPFFLACGNQTTPVCQRSLSPSPSPSPYPSAISSVPQSSPSCPDYFRWVHEDLRPWKSTGITEEMVGRARKFATFRLVVLAGRVYVESYRRAFQTRDVFTLWGILQLVSRYPGRVPDLDLMFNCDDTPVVKLADHRSSPPPPLFRYCKDDWTLDIVFPDWSFWGWAELNIKPWETLANDLKQGNQRVKWRDRKPYAYWKGNPWVSDSRRDLIKYKIYIEGRAWSVSQKYILACDSPVFFVKTHFHDFFSRALMPGLHFWPIREDDKCRSIKFAVEWSNEHQQEAQAMGRAGSSFVQEELKMDYVYDYMLHALTEYAKLLRYDPAVPEKATELCSESMACPATGLVKEFLMESMAKSTHDTEPCAMPPPFDPEALQAVREKKANAVRQVELWQQRQQQQAWNKGV
ncbi:hypothetical protein BHM03_00028953 [Ensete ventricosum]|uniref:Glycosyl transferase CAP10 domain-containing protein n=1 Tax=Ensete ventricosum TaxID=4639 RepID=A0A445MHV6_ENSVE|nr:hypothetical protein BHM03_00028953 [Ensete ventricosum]